MITITYDKIANYQDTISELLAMDCKTVNIQLDDKTKRIKRKYLILHLHFWWILIKWGMPVTTKYIMKDDHVDKSSIQELLTDIYRDILEIKHTTKSQYDFWTAINDLHNFIIEECNEYHCSLSIIELADLLEAKPIKDIVKKVKYDENTPTKVIEEKMKIHTKELDQALQDPFPENVLYDYHILGYVNKMQLPQMLLGVGTRTDINDVMIRYPIQSSFVDGLSNILEYMVESLAAKKCAFYNRIALPNSQYFARKLHLIASSISWVYPGDCGTTNTIPYYIHKNNAKDCVGKYYVDKGKIKEITFDNYKDLIGSTVDLRSPMACKYTDGVCEVCGGRMTNFLIEGPRIGIGSATKVAGQATQKILSAKHLQKTDTVTYYPPEELKSFLVSRADKVYFRKDREIALKDWKIGIPINDISRISDLRLIKSRAAINEEHFSKITKMMISSYRTDDYVTKIINMESAKRFPYFSKDMLIYIKDNYSRLDIGDTVWIPMDKFDIEKPIFKSLVVNDNMLDFVAIVKNFLESKIATYTSATEVLKDFSNIIYSKVSTNLFHIELLLKAYMITNEFNYQIPCVEDVDNVKFQTTPRINADRSLGTFFAFETLYGVLTHPKTYLIPRSSNPFDAFMGFSDKYSK
jgi:hypothetical protein